MCLTAMGPCSPQELEEAYAQARDILLVEAPGLALGPVGGVDFTRKEVELEFTVEAVSPAVFYAKLGEILRVLERSGFEYEGSKEHRLDLEPQPA
jgi:hypothetical protein